LVDFYNSKRKNGFVLRLKQQILTEKKNEERRLQIEAEAGEVNKLQQQPQEELLRV